MDDNISNEKLKKHKELFHCLDNWRIEINIKSENILLKEIGDFQVFCRCSCELTGQKRQGVRQIQKYTVKTAGSGWSSIEKFEVEVKQSENEELEVAKEILFRIADCFEK